MSQERGISLAITLDTPEIRIRHQSPLQTVRKVIHLGLVLLFLLHDIRQSGQQHPHVNFDERVQLFVRERCELRVSVRQLQQ